MAIDANKQLVRRFVNTIFNEKRTEALGEFLAPNVVLHHSSRTVQPGLEGIEQHQREIFAGLPDLHYEIKDMLAEDNKVTIRLAISGNHRGKYWGFPPTGKRLTSTAIHVLRLEDGKIAEVWSESDAQGMKEQLEASMGAPELVRSD